MQTYNTLTFSIKSSIATITLNRPKQANAISFDLAKELLDCATLCEQDSRIRAIIITGAGSMFCAGGDLANFLEFGDEVDRKLTELTTYLHAAILRLRHANAPIIVAVNGPAAGAGFSLAVLGDYVVASEKAKFSLAYTGVGLSPDGSASYFLPKLVGLRRAQELLLTNRTLTAQEALEWGLVNQTSAADELTENAMAIASKLAEGPTRAYGAVKAMLSDSYTNSLETQLDLETRTIAAMSRCQDGKEGIQAFSEKRKPVFKGI